MSGGRWNLTIVLLLPAVAMAESVRVETRPPDRPVAITAVHAEKPAVAIETATGSAVLDLPLGTWTLTASAPGTWSPSVDVDVEQLSAEAATAKVVTMALWPTGSLSGRVVTSKGVKELPASLDVAFQASPDDTSGVPAGTTSCPIVDAHWSCELPAGRLDLRFVAGESIHRYFWDVAVPVGERTTGATVELIHGSAVRGWVITHDRAPVAGVTVELVPKVTRQDPRSGGRIDSRKLTARVTDRGFFQIDALPTGDYIATATLDGYAPARASVRVFDDQATEIDDPPITLKSPRVVEVYVDPPTPLVGSAWIGELRQVDSRGYSLGVEPHRGEIPAGSAWVVAGVPDGQYQLVLRTTEDRAGPRGEPGPGWLHQIVEIESATSQIFATVEAVAVSGSLKLGKEPLAGKLIFGGKHGTVRRTLVADDDGKFSGWLPHPGLWSIEVASDEPPLEVMVNHLVEDAGNAEIEIEIPDTRLGGKVVLETGAPRPDALVRIHQNETTPPQWITVDTDQEGYFEAHGIPQGLVTLRAEDFELESDPVDVELRQDAEPPAVRLVLRQNVYRTGRVIAASSGLGVPGAEVRVFIVGAPARQAEIETTDEAGNFELTLPGTARELVLTASAPGFALRTLRRSATEDPLIVTVDDISGLLSLELPATYAEHRRAGRFGILAHAGSHLSVMKLREWSLFNGQEFTETEITAPLVEPGDYAACWVTMAQYPAVLAGVFSGLDCDTGTLSAAGELKLALPNRD